MGGPRADYPAWDLTQLLVDLGRALSELCPYIVLDDPFAYAHYFCGYPLDVALSRRLLRDFRGSAGDAILADVQQYAENGLRTVLCYGGRSKNLGHLGLRTQAVSGDLWKIIANGVTKKERA